MRHVYLFTLLLAVAFAFPRAGTKCTDDSACTTEYEYCTTEGKCKHMDLLPMNRGNEIAGFFVLTFLVAFSNFSGIGGGFGLIAFFCMYNFDVKTGIILSNAQIVISSIIRIATGLGHPHPLKGKNGTLFHFSIISLMIPMNALGAALATVVNRIIPDLVIVIVYAVILIGVLIFNLHRLYGIYKKEYVDP